MVVTRYRRPGHTSRGTTVQVRSQAPQRKRRTLTTCISAGASSASGPRHCRERVPWPTSTSAAPSGRDAVPHRGHCSGRIASVDGICSIQFLTDTLETTTVGALESTTPRARREGTDLWRDGLPVTVSCGRRRVDARPPDARLPSQRVPDENLGRGKHGQTRTAYPQIACARSALRPSNTVGGNNRRGSDSRHCHRSALGRRRT
jgi:hypothetical protein